MLPSPKSHCHSVGLPLDVSVNETVSVPVPDRGVPVKSATGAGGAVAVAALGRYSTCAVAVEVRLSVWPPNTADSSGVTSRNWPWTVTVTKLAAWAGQPLIEQVRSMSVAAIEIAEPFASNWTRHVTRLDAALQFAFLT